MTSSIITFFAFATTAAITLCPSWLTHQQSGNVYGPLFSIVDGNYAITSIPACVGLILGILAGSNDKLNAYGFFLLGTIASMLATLVTPNLGLIPGAGIFAAGYILLLIIAAIKLIGRVDYHAKPSIYAYSGSPVNHEEWVSPRHIFNDEESPVTPDHPVSSDDDEFTSM